MSPGQYLSRRIQETILERAIAEKVNVALLEAAYVVTTLHLSKQPGLVAEIRANIEMRERRGSHTQEQRGQCELLQQQPPPQQGAETHSNDERICTRSRPHEPSHAEAEMQRAGVGSTAGQDVSQDDAPRRLVSGTRRSRRAGELPQILGCEPFRTAPNRARPRDTARDRLPTEPPVESWEMMDAIDLRSEFLKRRCVLKSCPGPVRGRYRHAQRIALEAIETAARDGNRLAEDRAWKLFGLLSIMLLHKPQGTNFVSPTELERRFVAFARGEWAQLVKAAKPNALNGQPPRQRSAEEEEVITPAEPGMCQSAHGGVREGQEGAHKQRPGTGQPSHLGRASGSHQAKARTRRTCGQLSGSVRCRYQVWPLRKSSQVCPARRSE